MIRRWQLLLLTVLTSFALAYPSHASVGIGVRIGSGKPSSASGPPPSITSITFPNFGFASNYTPAVAPIINGTGTSFVGATSVLLDGVEHITHVTVAATTITVNSLVLSGHTPAKFQNIVVSGPWSSPVTWGAPHGDGAGSGWTTLAAGHHGWFPFTNTVTFGSAPAIASFTDLGDVTALTPTQATAGNQSNQATGGSGINGLPVAQTAHVSDTYTFASVAALNATGADGFVVANQEITAHIVEQWKMSGGNNPSYIPFDGTHMYSGFGNASVYNISAQLFVAPIVAGTFVVPYIVEEQMTSGGTYNLWINGSPQYTVTGQTVGFSTTPALIGAGQNGLPEFAAWLLSTSPLSAANANVECGYLSVEYNITCVTR